MAIEKYDNNYHNNLEQSIQLKYIMAKNILMMFDEKAKAELNYDGVEQYRCRLSVIAYNASLR